MIAVLCSAVFTGRPFAVYSDGAAGHDYVYVDDVVDACVRAGCGPAGTFIISTGRRTSLTEIHGLLSAILDGGPPPRLGEENRDQIS